MALGIVNMPIEAVAISHLDDVSNSTAIASNKMVTITWTDPEDLYHEGATVAKWAGTLLVRKEGSSPKSRFDGDIIVDSTVRNQYAEVGFSDTAVTNGTVYYYRFFPYDITGNYRPGTVLSAQPAATSISLPRVTADFEYDGTGKSPSTIYTSEAVIMSGTDVATDAGVYSLTFTLKSDDYIWSDGSYTAKTVDWEISPQSVAKPTIKTGQESLVFNSNFQSPELDGFDAIKMIQGGQDSRMTVGNYNMSITLSSSNYNWAGEDSTIREINLPWSIVKAPNIMILSADSGNVTYGESTTFTVTNNPSNGALSVSTNDTDYIDVEITGSTVTVTSKQFKSANIAVFVTSAATSNYESGTAVFTAIPQKATSTITLSKSSMSLNTEVTSDTAVVTYVGDGIVQVSSSNAEIANGVYDSSTGVITVTGYKNGSTTITISSLAGANYYAASSRAIEVAVSMYAIMTVKIDQTNSNPATCCTYADDAVNMTPGSDAWDEWFGEYPVLFKNGVEVVKINPNNYAQDINGNSIDITSGNAGDVMVAFPRKGLKISTDENDVVTISMTDNPHAEDEGFKYYAHQRGTTDKDVFYLGAYEGSEVSSKLRSLSGKDTVRGKLISNYRTLSRANSPASNGSGGSGYDSFGWFQLIFIQSMYTLKYKNLDSRSALGQGNIAGTVKSTGTTNSEGLTYGSKSDGSVQMKLFGLEDLWGNNREFIDGMFINSNLNILTATQGFNDSGSGYTNQGNGASEDIHDWITKIQGTTEKGFLIKAASGSSSTYFCNSGWCTKSTFPEFGGDWRHGGGIFTCSTQTYNETHGYVTSRLMYL